MTRYWVPWYSGVVGNEKVDTSAKNAPTSVAKLATRAILFTYMMAIIKASDGKE